MARNRGFTLIELMIVVLIIAVLAGLAYSGYQKQIRKSRRAEAKQSLSDVALRQEKWRSNNVAYLGTDSTVAEKATFGSLPTASYYTIAITSTKSGTGFTATAAPKTGTDQVNDTCGTLTWTLNAGVISKTATGGTDCW